MRAVVLEKAGRPANLILKDIETPVPGPGEVRVRLHAAALNRRDYWITINMYPAIQLPCILGSDGAGVVDAVGAGVKRTLEGKEVIIYPARHWGNDRQAFGPDFRILGMPDPGTFAEYICVNAECIYSKPAHLTWQQSAAVPLAGLTSWRAVTTQGEIKKGHRVLITGTGSGVSSFAVLWCVNLDAEVYVSSGSEDKIAHVKSLGVVDGVNYHHEGCYQELSSTVGGFDVIIDSAGGSAVNTLIDTLKPAGRYVFFGATTGNPPSGLEMAKIYYRHIRIQGTTMGSPEEFSEMLTFLNKKKLVPVVFKTYPLAQAVDAYQLMMDYRQIGKIVLDNQ